MIGLQKTAYTVTEANTIVLVCTAVESGNIAGRTITIDYETTDDSAQGKNCISNGICTECDYLCEHYVLVIAQGHVDITVCMVVSGI